MRGTNKFKQDLSMFNTKRDILTMVKTIEQMVERMDIIEEHFELEFQNNLRNAEAEANNKLEKKTTKNKFEVRVGEGERRSKPGQSYTSKKKSKNNRNGFGGQVLKDDQSPIQNYKEEVESINQILSREIVRINHEKAWQEHHDDQKTQNRQPINDQKDWSNFEEGRGSESFNQ